MVAERRPALPDKVVLRARAELGLQGRDGIVEFKPCLNAEGAQQGHVDVGP